MNGRGTHNGFSRGVRHATWFIIVLSVSLTTACTPPLGDSEADLALEDFVAGSGSRLKQITSTPVRQTLRYQIEGRYYTGDLYLSDKPPRAGIVLVPGVVPDGKDDARLVALANTLARLRFAVLTPDLVGPRNLKVRSNDVREVADAFAYLVSRPELAPGGRAGIAGFSYGAGPVLLAGLEPDIREQVRFILTLGGYYNLESIVTYFTTGYYRDETTGKWRHLSPRPYALRVFGLSNTDLLVRDEDRQRLRAALWETDEEDDTEGLTPLSGLAADAEALQNLLINEDPARVPALMERLSASMRAELEGINPAGHDLSGLRAQVIMLHGRGDNIIPYTESIALARALPTGQVSLFLIEGFAHVDVKLTRDDIPRLRRVMELLLDQRE